MAMVPSNFQISSLTSTTVNKLVRLSDPIEARRIRTHWIRQSNLHK